MIEKEKKFRECPNCGALHEVDDKTGTSDVYFDSKQRKYVCSKCD